MTGDSSDVPLDEAERERCLETLNRHWAQRTLDPGDHERRTTAVRRARTRGDLDAAMADLPSLGGDWGPVLAGPGASVAQPAPRPAQPGSVLDRDDDGRTDGLIKLPQNTAGTIVSLVPLLCILLFFTVSTSWVIFLAIPIVAILIYGPDGKAGGCHGRRRDR